MSVGVSRHSPRIVLGIEGKWLDLWIPSTGSSNPVVASRSWQFCFSGAVERAKAIVHGAKDRIKNYKQTIKEGR